MVVLPSLLLLLRMLRLLRLVSDNGNRRRQSGHVRVAFILFERSMRNQASSCHDCSACSIFSGRNKRAEEEGQEKGNIRKTKAHVTGAHKPGTCHRAAGALRKRERQEQIEKEKGKAKETAIRGNA